MNNMPNKDTRKPGERWSYERGYKLPFDLQEKFRKQVMKLAEKVFGRDCDGDLPVDIFINDRTRFEPLSHHCVQYRHKIEDEVMDPLKNQPEEPTQEEIEKAEKVLSERLDVRLDALLLITLGLPKMTTAINSES